MTALPAEFVERMKVQLGHEADDFFASLSVSSPTSIRTHQRKGKTPFPAREKVIWCDNGVYLEDRPSFHLDPHWHGGAYYVQEASSMILDFILKQIQLPDQPRILVDMCAAPGGKTGILAQHLRSCDVLVANEVVSQRRTILWENLVKGGFLNTFLSGESAAAFKHPIADLMLIDAPCAGEGMMRKDPEAIRQWSPSLVQSCSLMQQKIVQDATKAIKPGGILIYSTCSYSMAENIENINRFIDDGSFEPMQLSFPEGWGIETISFKNATGYQLYPHRVKGEGLFVSVLRKKNADEVSVFSPKKSPKYSSPLPDWLASQYQDATDLLVLKNNPLHPVFHKVAEEKINEVMWALPKAELIASSGEQKGKDFIPAHFLAMSGLYNKTIPIMELGYQTALDYLERQTSTLPQGNSLGWHIIRYEETDLGWAKYTQQGWKNHYPMHWRLRDRRPRKADPSQ